MIRPFSDHGPLGYDLHLCFCLSPPTLTQVVRKARGAGVGLTSHYHIWSASGKTQCGLALAKYW